MWASTTIRMVQRLIKTTTTSASYLLHGHIFTEYIKKKPHFILLEMFLRFYFPFLTWNWNLSCGFFPFPQVVWREAKQTGSSHHSGKHEELHRHLQPPRHPEPGGPAAGVPWRRAGGWRGRRRRPPVWWRPRARLRDGNVGQRAGEQKTGFEWVISQFNLQSMLYSKTDNYGKW